MPTIFFTGFPGFLGSELLPRVVARTDDVALCLVQPKFRALAEQRAKEIEAAHPALKNRIRLIDGDLTQPLDHVPADDVREIYHLAAVYDINVAREVGMRVNVVGTTRVLDLAERASRLERMHYVSTCYVSGRYPGVFKEDDLEIAQTFNNFYEETKHLAEVEVRKRMSRVPITVYRPSVVVGDSSTGATQKFDGPYFVMQWLMRQPRLAVLPVVGRPSRYAFNVVPRDFMIAAMTYLSGLKSNTGATYAIADPDPLTVDETINTIAAATNRTVLRIPMTRAMAKGALQYVPGVYRLMRIPATAVDYFVHPTTYDTTRATADLEGSGIRPPKLRDYAPRLVEFARRHPEIGSAAMV
ncbi:MAG TPA: SDR family oxidoreductase [Thermoanaerobaculia bacterium]|jgi:nucleoside-diphosphate-sugar epimerase|nr:SDR family oxidoreductase [Thermoanaerobaculia bacterium]